MMCSAGFHYFKHTKCNKNGQLENSLQFIHAVCMTWQLSNISVVDQDPYPDWIRIQGGKNGKK